MTLSDLRELIYRNRRKAIVGLSVVALVIGAIILTGEYGQKKGPPAGGGQEVEYPEGSQPSPTSVDVSGIEDLTATIPSEMETYTIVSGVASFSEEEVLGFAAALDFGGEWDLKDQVDAGYRYIFTKGEKALTVHTAPPSLFFSTGTALPEGEVPDREQAAVVGKAFLNRLGLEGLAPIPGSHRLVTVDEVHFFVAPNLAAANLASISFGPEKNRIPIIGDTPASLSATIFLDAADRAVSFQYYKVNLQTESAGTVKVKPLETALAEVRIGKGEVVSAESFEELEADARPNVLSSFSPNSVFLAYYLSGGDKLLPVYVFGGKGILKSGQGEVLATVYLSAIQP